MTAHDHGTLLAEARLLLEAVAARLEPLTAPADQPEDATATPVADPACTECGHDPAVGCTSCPICKLLSVVRGERPELTGRLAEGALQVIGGLRTLLDRTGPDQPAADPGAPNESTAKPSAVQHIDVD